MPFTRKVGPRILCPLQHPWYWALCNGGRVPWVLASWAQQPSFHAGRGIPEFSGKTKSRGSHHITSEPGGVRVPVVWVLVLALEGWALTNFQLWASLVGPCLKHFLGSSSYPGCPPPGRGRLAPALLSPGPTVGRVGGCLERGADHPWGFLTRTWGLGGGKTRTKDKYRVVYTDHQRLELEKEFQYNRYIMKLLLVQKTESQQVKIWFQNRRAKERKMTRKKLQHSQQASTTTPTPPVLGGHADAHAAPSPSSNMVSDIKSEKY
uniref:Caudal type homeobox 1a n=1 Tax=Oryzias latipes TaxID=8090 RepID=A0A3B3HC34_ORYLA